MRTLAIRFLRDQSGATAIEYGLIIGLISIVIIGAMSAIGYAVEARFNDVQSCVDWDGSGAAPTGC